MKLRIVLDVFLLFSIFILPWWLLALIIIALVFYYDKYYEALVASILYDSTFNTDRSFLFFAATLITVIVFVFIEWLKRRLRAYS